MKCDRVIQRLLLLDHNERPDRRTAGHLDRCPACRTEYERLCLVMTQLNPDTPDSGTPSSGTVPSFGGLPIGTEELIMASVRERADIYPRKPRERTARGPTNWHTWVAIGGLMVVGLVTLPYNAALTYLYRLPGSTIVATTGVAMGAIATAYFCVFVATHLEELSALTRRNAAPK